jgi:hypothetical protein
MAYPVDSPNKRRIFRSVNFYGNFPIIVKISLFIRIGENPPPVRAEGFTPE